MNARPTLHILFTMDCQAPTTGAVLGRPRNYEMSARSIESFCNRVLNAGYAVTLFVSPECAEEHGPLVEELAGRGVEPGLYLHPQSLAGSRYKRPLGAYSAAEQREIIEYARERVEAAVGLWPRSFRPDQFSANDDTFQVLYELGFRQGSVSNPGRTLRGHGTVWAGTEVDAHYVDPTNRLHSGNLPFLEIPVTADPERLGTGGVPYELCIESGDVESWHRPIAEGQLQRMAEEDTSFRTLCIFTTNAIAYHLGDNRPSTNLDLLLDYLDTLDEHYEVVPVTLSSAHERFRRAA